MEDLIVLKDLRKVYKMGDEKILALNDINLTISKSEIICLLGTSGSGKSTLLNMMAGLEKPTKGKVIVDGFDLTSLSGDQLRSVRRRIGMIFQH